MQQTAKTRKVVQPPKKQCSLCRIKKPIDDFYSNAYLVDEQKKDRWCKDCVSKMTTKDNVREYFWENRRTFTEDIWNAALKLAEKQLASNTVYNKSPDDRRAKLLERAAVQVIPSLLVRTKPLKLTEDQEKMTYADAVASGAVDIGEEDEDNVKEYSEFFNGNFTKRELEYMENYYSNLNKEFDFDNENRRDYARKCARASMVVDKKQDDYAAGRCSSSDVKDAMQQFDMLSRSAQFAECKRRPEENSGMNSWSEMTLYLETHGHPCTRKIEWEPDSVDKTINEYRYIVESLNLDQI